MILYERDMIANSPQKIRTKTTSKAIAKRIQPYMMYDDSMINIYIYKSVCMCVFCSNRETQYFNGRKRERESKRERERLVPTTTITFYDTLRF